MNPTHHHPDTTTSDQEDGFSLIELMVVVLIIAILIAIAIPTFFGVRTAAQDIHAKSNLQNTYTFALIEYSNHGSYLDANFTNLNTNEGNTYTFLPANQPSTGPNTISIGVTDNTFHATLWSDSGYCLMVRDLPNHTDPNVRSRSFATSTNPQTDCTAANAGGTDPDNPFDSGDTHSWQREW